jgi:LacI family transcriptional regulator
LANIKDVSKLARVSKSTVSRLISGHGYVSDEARTAIAAAIGDLGYRPNNNARGLRSNRSNIVGGVVADLRSPFYAQLVGGMQQACRRAGKGLLLSGGFGEPQEEERATLELLDRSCDGLLLNLEFPLSQSARDALRKSGVPVVMVGCQDRAVAAGSVTLDNVAGARMAMETLLDAGHRKIVHLGGSEAHKDSVARLTGIAQALAKYDLELSGIIVRHGTFTEEHGHEAVCRLIAEGIDFTAIFAGDDDIAAGAMMALKGLGRDIPKDVSIVGFDDNFHARHLTPPLTTIRQPIGLAGEQAVEMLLAILDGGTPKPKNIVIPTELLRRQSVAAVPPA